MHTIEYFYSAHSAFAHIGHARLLEICKAHDCRLTHKPMELRAVVKAAGGLPFAKRTQAHTDYFFGVEIKRWAAFRGVPVMNGRPTHHDNPLDLPNGFLIAAIQQGADIDALAGAVLRAHWRDDADLADAGALARIARATGIDPEPLLEAARSAPVRQTHQSNTDEAIRRGVLGSPTYIVDGEMFYGQDRLEMVERTVTGHPMTS